MQISLNMVGTQSWFGGDMRPVVDLIGIADKVGIDVVGFPEHVVMGEDFSAYPYGQPTFTSDSPFYEPVVLLAYVAARTSRIRLSTGVLLLPLRPAALIAKQIATLDALCGGRIELGVGVGWQKAEYDMLGLPWEGRFGRMMETIEACRVLWSQAPASFSGKYVNFEGAYSLPFPAQGRDIPIYLGVAPTEVNIDRMAISADGWAPTGLSYAEIGAAMAKIRSRLVERGRDPNTFGLKVAASPVRHDGVVDVGATIAKLDDLAALGCTQASFHPYHCCAAPEEFESFVSELQARKEMGR